MRLPEIDHPIRTYVAVGLVVIGICDYFIGGTTWGVVIAFGALTVAFRGHLDKRIEEHPPDPDDSRRDDWWF